MSYKRLIPCIFILGGKAVKWFDDPTVVSEDVIALAKEYSDNGADELLVFDLSNTDQDHDESIELMKKINRVIRIPMVAGGNVKRQEDVKKILYTGAKRAMLNFSKPDSQKLIEEVAKRFGKEKIAVSLNDFDALFKQQHLIQTYSSQIVFMHRLDLNSVVNITDIPCVVVTDTLEKEELFKILECPGVKGLSGMYVSQREINCADFKEECSQKGIRMTSFESLMDFSEFKLNSDGLLPVVTQHYKTSEVLMVAYMNQEAFEKTVKTGRPGGAGQGDHIPSLHRSSHRCQQLGAVAVEGRQPIPVVDHDVITVSAPVVGGHCHRPRQGGADGGACGDCQIHAGMLIRGMREEKAGMMAELLNREKVSPYVGTFRRRMQLV